MQQAGRQRYWTLGLRNILAVALMLTALTPLVRFADASKVRWAALGVVAPCLAMAVVPGLAILCAVGGCSRRRLTAVLALSIALSLPVAQLATVVSLGLQVPLFWLAFGVWGCSLALLAWGVARTELSTQLLVTPGDLLVLAGLLPLAIALYLKGTPFFADEFQIHVSLVRRFVSLQAPHSGNLFPIVDVPYTHPFPSIHGLMGMISVLGGADPLFVFHKLRFFWGPSALLLLFVFAERFFGDRRFGLVAFVGALALTLAGPFADYGALFWAQLATYSHPSDIALNVHLPALLVCFLYFLDAQKKHSLRFFAAATAALLVTLTMTHIRESVQFVVYAGAFAVVLAALRFPASIWRRSAAMTLLGLVVCKAYTWLHGYMVADVSNFQEQIKSELRNQVAQSNLWDLVAEPLYPVWASSLFAGVFPLILLATPVVIFIFRRQHKVWLGGASLLAFLLLIRFPLFSIPYTYLTFWEILSTSVRNVTFFIYVLAGPAFYLLAQGLVRIPGRLASVAAAALAALGLAAISHDATAAFMHHAWLRQAFYAIVMVLLLAAAGRTFFDRSLRSGRALAVRGFWAEALAVGMLVQFAYCTRTVAASPLSVHSIMTKSPVVELPLFLTADDLLKKSPQWLRPHCKLGDFNDLLKPYSLECPLASSSPPQSTLVDWARLHLPSDARLAVNTYAFYSPSTFLSQAVVALPLVQTSNFYYLSQLMPRYLNCFSHTATEHREQPFFNTVETPAERRRFLKDLRVTHVLLDPMYYDRLKPILGAEAEVLETVFDDQQWAVYRVRR